MKMQQLCNSDMNLSVKFQVCNYRQAGNHPLYGEFTTTLSQLSAQPSSSYALKDARGQQRGTIYFDNFTIIHRPSFVEYLRSGWFINMSVAIDFTASNGELIEPSSLHRQYTDGRLNDYEQAIHSVGSILEPYAYDRKFALFGFGGIPRFAGSTAVSHCFNLSGQPDPVVQGFSTMFQLYKQAVVGTGLSGPTYFSKVLQIVLDYMKSNL